MYRRGEVYYIHKGVVGSTGSEMEAGRPAVIVSNDKANMHSSCVEIVYLTTQPKKDLPTHVKVKSCMTESTVLCEQITSVFAERIGNYMCTLTDEELEKIDEALMVSLGLDRYIGSEEDYEEDYEEEPEFEEDEPQDDEYVETLKKEITRLTAERDAYEKMYTQLIGKLIK